MKDNTRSEFVANEDQSLGLSAPAPRPPSWAVPSHCKRPPLTKPAPTLLERLLAFLGL